MSERDRYHHGDLRNSLLRAGNAMLRDGGMDTLTLRAVAAKAGVSHGAPAHHFVSLRQFLTALAVQAFEDFTQCLRAARAGAAPDARAQLEAICDGYVGFAQQEPERFRLMFTLSGRALDWEDEDLRVASNAAFAELSEVCRIVLTQAPIAAAKSEIELALLVWSTVHGFAQLRLTGRLAVFASGEPSRPNLESYLFGL